MRAKVKIVGRQCCVAGGGLGVYPYRSERRSRGGKESGGAREGQSREVAGDIGLLDTEKKHDCVTKDGNSSRLITIAKLKRGNQGNERSNGGRRTRVCRKCGIR